MSRREHFEQQAFAGMPAAAPSTASSAPQGPSEADHAYQYVTTGKMPEGANGPHVRAAINRIRADGQTNPRAIGILTRGDGDPNRTPLGRPTTPGIRSVWDVSKSELKVSPFEHTAFRRVGETREIPLVGDHAVTTLQKGVNRNRVEQIRKFPGMANDPRFPGRELPNVLETDTGENIVIQGNHRMIAGMEDRNGQLAMTAPARVIPHERLGEAAQIQAEGAARFRRTRPFHDQVHSARIMRGDAVVGTPRLAERLRVYK